MKTNLQLLVVSLCLAFASGLPAQESPAPKNPPASGWREQYIASPNLFVSSSVTRTFYDLENRQAISAKAKLVITAVEGDEEVGGKELHPRFDSRSSSHGCEISVEGQVHFFAHSSRGTKGGGYPTIPAEDFKRLGELLANLPDDGDHLPPAGRRLILQAAEGGSFRIKIYDRGNLTSEVLEILRLSGSRIRTWMPTFEPVTKWQAHEFVQSGALCLTPDGQQIISPGRLGCLRFWNPDTQQLVKEVLVAPSSDIRAIAFSPNGTLAALEVYGQLRLFSALSWERLKSLEESYFDSRGGINRHEFSAPQFSADGRVILAESNEPAIKTFAVASVLSGNNEQALPLNAITFAPATKSNRAVYTDTGNVIVLWDKKQQRPVATLAENACARLVAFSPDESLVAIVSADRSPGNSWSGHRIRIWRTDNGHFLHELRPFEQSRTGPVEGLCWTPDGKYVLAATSSHSFFTSRGIGVWNVKSGRHRGEFTGPSQRLTGMTLLPDGRRLVAGCGLGVIRIWDLEAALRKIGEFEMSIGEQE